jgi:replicative DNA helicase
MEAPQMSWDTPAELFADDPQRAAALDAIAAVIRGAGTRPVEDTFQALGELVSEHRHQRLALEPPAAATSLLGSLFDDIQSRYERRQTTGQDAMGHSTGYGRLDRILGGLDRGRMSVMLAAPGAGKTTFSNQLAYTVAESGAPVLYVTFENSPDDLVLKQIARIAGKSAQHIRRGRVDPDSLQAAYKTFRSAGGQRLYYVNGTASTTIDSLSSALEHLQRTYPGTYPLVIVDFLQRLATTASVTARGAGLDDMRGRVGIIAQQLRGLANDSGAHIWAISSTNRAAYDKEKSTPGLASARESGDIEFAADHVVTFAPEYGAPISMTTDPFALSVVKNRHGETGTVSIAREKGTMRMLEVDAKVTTFTNQVQSGWASA